MGANIVPWAIRDEAVVEVTDAVDIVISLDEVVAAESWTADTGAGCLAEISRGFIFDEFEYETVIKKGKRQEGLSDTKAVVDLLESSWVSNPGMAVAALGLAALGRNGEGEREPGRG